MLRSALALILDLRHGDVAVLLEIPDSSIYNGVVSKTDSISTGNLGDVFKCLDGGFD